MVSNRYRHGMGAEHAGVDVPSARASRDRLFWAATTSGVATGLLAAIVALRMGLIVLDRQMVLPDWAAEIWYHVGNVSDARVFTVLYVVTPLAWVVLSVWWWLTRPHVRRSLWVAAAVAAVVVVTLPAAWAWFATAFWHVERSFDIDAISRDLVYSGFTDTDYWGVAVVAGLTCLLCLVLANLVWMLRKTTP